MKCPYCMEEIQDGAIRCKHCKTSIVGSSPLQQYPQNGAAQFIPQPEKPAPWFQITTLITGVVLIAIILVADPWDRDTIVGSFFLSSIQIALGIGAINVSSHGRGMAIAGLVLGILSFLITCGMAV